MNFCPPPVPPQGGMLLAPPLEGEAGRGLLVENIGVEPMTSCVQGRRSSQLS